MMFHNALCRFFYNDRELWNIQSDIELWNIQLLNSCTYLKKVLVLYCTDLSLFSQNSTVKHRLGERDQVETRFKGIITSGIFYCFNSIKEGK
jgi:hypothetical protein